MTGWALGSYGAFLALAFGVRSRVHRRLTGEFPWVLPSSRVQWVSEGLLAAGVASTLAAAILGLTGALAAVDALDSTAWNTLGLALVITAIGLSSAAQAQMGRSWRAGVDPAARTELVTGGVFGMVRNPFYVSMILAGAGVAFMVPSVLSFAAVAMTVAGAEAVVRLSEEPYLESVHGDAYASYKARTGRFVPRFGRIPQTGRKRP